MRKNRKIPLEGKIKFAVVGDGKCEAWYIQMLKRNERSIGIDIKPEIPQKKKLGDQFYNIINLSKHYDKVFWLIDLDVIISETRLRKGSEKTVWEELKGYCRKIEDVNKEGKIEKIRVIINNPCLEFWFLLHFESTGKYFSTCDDAIKRLKKYLPDYQKSQTYFTKQNKDIYIQLKPHLAAALLNAEKIGVFDFNNPYSGISQMQFFFKEIEARDLYTKQ